MTVFFEIESALQTRLLTISGHPKIQWENDDTYEPVAATRYWRPTNLPYRSELVTANALQKHSGIYQVDVFVEMEIGTALLMADLDLIYDAFNTVESLVVNNTRVSILDVGRGRLVRDEAWYKGYIEIKYVCYSH